MTSRGHFEEIAVRVQKVRKAPEKLIFRIPEPILAGVSLQGKEPVSDDTLGLLECLPSELLGMVISQLSYVDQVLLALSSKRLASLVVNHSAFKQLAVAVEQEHVRRAHLEHLTRVWGEMPYHQSVLLCIHSACAFHTKAIKAWASMVKTEAQRLRDENKAASKKKWNADRKEKKKAARKEKKKVAREEKMKAASKKTKNAARKGKKKAAREEMKAANEEQKKAMLLEHKPTTEKERGGSWSWSAMRLGQGLQLGSLYHEDQVVDVSNADTGGLRVTDHFGGVSASR